MKKVGMKCRKCGSWYLTEAHVETKMDTMSKVVEMRDKDTGKVYEEEVTAQFPRVVLSRWGDHQCENKSKKGKYNYD